ncbi:uncharacterized protein M437DRAFT_42271 [Aureobasidium melanogenum CBS 110374]|uniref:DUF6987 domain-containing protein n=2 Tax=Aureobasidium melanogenum TaxID=46634 RepID=A0A074W5V7_AURM1|nr:uncharacterized protein M437DRAFT_42271 [Aureobasidium melanogenum CBS 110374]KEQ65287.1 hypothetical protein M437DRAFT_42271 [Aureobasidium melanogenum CBS 110374]
MAPSPAAGKATGGAPKTPTKLGRKPQSQTSQPPKLGQQAASGARKASAPEGAKQPETPQLPEKPEAGDVQQKAGEAAQGAQEKAGKTAEDAKSKAEGAAEEPSKGPLSKVSQAGDNAKGQLEEQAPQPIDDSNDNDTAAGAEDTADDDDTEDTADDDKTVKAGDEADDNDDDVQDTTGKVADDAQKTGKQSGGNLLKGAKGLAGKASGLAGKAAQDPKKAAQDVPKDAQETAEDVKDTAEDTAEDAAESAQDTADDAKKDTAEDATEQVKDTAEDTAEQAEDAAGDATDKVGETAEDTKDTAEDAADGELPEINDISDLPVDLSVLKGLEVAEDGIVSDQDGNPIGKLAEGDAEDLAGYPIGDDGEILDDDGDLVGRVELLPEQVKKQMADLKSKGELPEGAEKFVGDLPDTDDIEKPNLAIFKGLTCDPTGNIFNDEGDTIGQVTDGDPQELMNATLNEYGEFIDEDGNVIGHADIHPDAPEDIYDQVQQAADDAQDAADDAQDNAEDTAKAADKVDEAADHVDDAADDVKDAAQDIEDELPGIEALQGRELNKAGEVVDDQGEVLGQIDDESLKEKLESGELKAEDLKINEDGEVVDADDNVLGKVGLAEGAAEKLGGRLPSLDLRILDGRKVNKKGKILDDEGDEIGELAEGDPKECAGKKVNDKGEVLDQNGKVIGKVSVVPGEAAENATKELQTELGENVPDEEQGEDEEQADEEEEPQGPQFKIPDLDILEGLKVNKKGKILNEDGEEIGELTSGDLSECAGKKVNDKGEVLDAEGNTIGRVKALPQEIPQEELEEAEEAADKAEDAQDAAEDAENAEEGAENAEEGAEDAAEDAESNLPPLSVLEGLQVNKSGKIVDSNGTVVGELTEGDAKKLSKSGVKCDDQGQFWDDKGHVIGRAKTVPVEEDEESPFAGLDGLIVVKDGWVEDENGNRVGQLVEGDPKKLVGRAVDEDGDILDKKGSVVGHAERYEEADQEPEPEEEPVDLSSLAGKTVNKAGFVIGDEGVPVARLVEGKAKELAGKKLDDQGQIWNDQGKVIGRVEMIPEDERESKPDGPFAGLQGLRVVADGKVADEDENIVGEIVEGNAKRLIGLAVDEDGDVMDRYGNVKGHAEPLEEEEEEGPVDNSLLNGKKLNKQGFVVDEKGIPVGKLLEGNVKELAGRLCDENGDIHNDTGKVVGHCEVLPENERVSRAEGPFAGHEGLRVNKEGFVVDSEDNVVGKVTEGDVKKLVGLQVDEDGDINDKYGNAKGHAEPYEEEEAAPIDNSILDGKKLNKQGFVVNEDGIPLGKLVEGNVKELAGRRCDEEGKIHGDTGKVVGRCEVLPENERVARPEGPFAGLEGLHVNKEGYVEDAEGNRVGIITEGNVKRLVGLSVDEDGDISDKYGNTKGHAEPWEEEEQTPEDLSALAGCTVNKAGNVVDSSGTIIGRVSEGDPSTMVGKKVDGQGQIWDNAGNVIGKAELAKGADTKAEGPFAGFDSITVNKEGYVVTPDGSIVGRITEGDVKKLVAHKVDEDGEIQDKNGNLIGKAERWEPEEKERKINPMSGRRVNKEGEVRDENGDVMGRLTAGDLGHCVGLEVDDNGYVVDNDGNKVGEVTLIGNIIEDEEIPEEELTEEEKEERRKREEERQIAEKMGTICTQTLERVQPICKQITDHIEAADRTPREELDEEDLVNKVKPLIEEGGRILQECNGSLRGLDPDGHIAAQAKGRAGTKEATPEEYRLADTLKELTETVVTTIDNAKKRISDMPHAKKKLNPLWGLMTQPLFQILAAVGLLLTGVLGLVGQLLNGLGLGGLVNGLLGGLGIDKLLGGLGLGSVADSLGLGKKDKKKSGGGASSLPIVGGLFGKK